MKNISRKYGFTLLELLVVVIIIAVLAAVAWPQYKHAVLKSRFSKVMPLAKAVADAQEVYYLGRNMYALGQDELDITPVSTEKTTVTISQTDGYNYVMAQTSQVPGVHYIRYQKHSENYPGEIHCEAEDENEEAQWLCEKGLGATKIGRVLNPGFTTYLIQGNGAGVPPELQEVLAGASCDKAIERGLNCTLTENADGSTTKKICQAVGTSHQMCVDAQYNEDGDLTFKSLCLQKEDGVCSALLVATYDANGKQTFYGFCDSDYGGVHNADGSCKKPYSVSFYEYDAYGNMIAQHDCEQLNGFTCERYGYSSYQDRDENGNIVRRITCKSFDEDNNCSSWAYGDYYQYDSKGNKTFEASCYNSGYAASYNSDGSCKKYSFSSEYTYDSKGNVTRRKTCSSFDENNNCLAYGSATETGYNSNGTKAYVKSCSGATLDSQTGTCIGGSSATEYQYDGQGRILQELSCNISNTDASTGKCKGANKTIQYNYDAQGNSTVVTCSSYSNGVCSAATMQTYNADGKLVTDRRKCNSFDSSGNCISWTHNYGATDYTYEDGVTVKKTCVVNADGTCASYSMREEFSYDAAGHLTSEKRCGGSNINTSTGDCIAYSFAEIYPYDSFGNKLGRYSCAEVAADGSCAKAGGYRYVLLYDDDGQLLTGDTNNGIYCTADAAGNCITMDEYMLQVRLP